MKGFRSRLPSATPTDSVQQEEGDPGRSLHYSDSRNANEGQAHEESDDSRLANSGVATLGDDSEAMGGDVEVTEGFERDCAQGEREEALMRDLRLDLGSFKRNKRALTLHGIHPFPESAAP